MNLYNQMNKHIDAIPDLYAAIKPYIPDFFRLTSISAQSAGQGRTLVTMEGVISSYQQYADLMLALLRIPKLPTAV